MAESITQINATLRDNGINGSVTEDTYGRLEIYSGNQLWMRGVPRDTSSMAIVSAIRADNTAPASSGCCGGGRSLGGEIVQAVTWGFFASAGATAFSMLLSGVAHAFTGGSD